MLCSILSICIKMNCFLSCNEIPVGKVQKLPGTGQHQPPTGTWSYVNVLCNRCNLFLRFLKVE